MSLFSKPAWAATETDSADEPETNLFSHSNRSYRDIVAEQECKKQAKLNKKKAKEERRASGKHKARQNSPGESSLKKRRISLEEDEPELSNSRLSPEPSDLYLSTHKDTHASGNGLERNPKLLGKVRRSPRINRHVDPVSPWRTWEQIKKATVVDLGESDEDNGVSNYVPPQPVVAKADEESDDEFAELARRARQQRQQKHQTAKSHTPDVGGHSPSPGLGAQAESGQASLPTPPPDPTIQLLVSSLIADTNPLIVHRKLSQNISEIRKVWCQKQGFSQEFARGVFFIHRLRRVYDVTTCRSLGLDVDGFGNVIMKGAEGTEDVEKVHLQAVTEEIFEQMKAEKAKESQKRKDGLPDGGQANASAEDDDEATQQDEPLIRLFLKAKGKEPFKLKVKASTMISKIVAAYSKTQSIEGQAVHLEFDGERLEPDEEVQNTEISDMDCIDVHIR